MGVRAHRAELKSRGDLSARSAAYKRSVSCLLRIWIAGIWLRIVERIWIFSTGVRIIENTFDPSVGHLTDRRTHPAQCKGGPGTRHRTDLPKPTRSVPLVDSSRQPKIYARSGPKRCLH